MYSQGQKIELDNGVELGRRENPYFNRDIFTFCSHKHTPNSFDYGGSGMIESSNGIYIAWNLFEEYATIGSIILKDIIIFALEKLLGEKRTLITNLPAQGIVTLTYQEQCKRYVNHLLYASPVRRGESIEIIEDIIPIYNVEVAVKVPLKAKNVYLAPQNTKIDFKQDGDTVKYVTEARVSPMLLYNDTMYDTIVQCHRQHIRLRYTAHYHIISFNKSVKLVDLRNSRLQRFLVGLTKC